MAKFVVITGLDGVGTSTVGKACVELDTGAVLMRTPAEPFVRFRPEIDVGLLTSGSTAAHFLFYLASVVDVSAKIDQHLADSSQNVYCVRYLLDTVVSHRADGLQVDLTYDLGFARIRRPDLTVVLGLSETTRQARLRERGKGYLDERLDDEIRRQRFLSEFKRFGAGLVWIDCDGKSSEHIASDIVGRVRDLK